MKWIISAIIAVLGGLIGYAGTCLYSIGVCGEIGPLAGRGGIVFWYLSWPGQLVGIPFGSFGLSHGLSSVIGGALLWGGVAWLIANLGSRRRVGPS